MKQSRMVIRAPEWQKAVDALIGIASDAGWPEVKVIGVKYWGEGDWLVTYEAPAHIINRMERLVS